MGPGAFLRSELGYGCIGGSWHVDFRRLFFLLPPPFSTWFWCLTEYLVELQWLLPIRPNESFVRKKSTFSTPTARFLADAPISRHSLAREIDNQVFYVTQEAV